MPWCQYRDTKLGHFRQKVLYIVRHYGVCKSIDCRFQYEFIVRVSELRAQPPVEAHSNRPCDKVVEEVRNLLVRLTVNLHLFRPAEYGLVFKKQWLR